MKKYLLIKILLKSSKWIYTEVGIELLQRNKIAT